MYKRVITSMVALLLVVALFPFNKVYAVTDNTNTRTAYQISSNINDVTIQTTAVQLFTELTTPSNGATTSGINDAYFQVQYVTVILNNTDTYKTVNNIKISTAFSNVNTMNANIQSINNQSNDFYFGISETASTIDFLRVFASAEYSYNGGILIPPHTQLVGIAEVQYKSFREYGSGSQSAEPLLNGISYYGNITGSNVDPSTVTEPGSTTGVQLSADLLNPSNGISGSARISYGRSYVLSDSVDVDTQYHSYTMVMPIQIYFRVDNTSGLDISSSGLVRIESFLPNSYTNMSWEVKYSESDLWYAPRVYVNSGNLRCDVAYVDTTNGYIITPGTHIGIVILNIYYSDVAPIVPSSFSFSMGTFSVANSPSDQLNQQSSNVTSDIENIHSQEEQLFNQNESALQSSGISNFNFDQSTIGGFTQFRTLFERLWESLAPYTIVYIFSMMLSLALLIIRYRPPKRGGDDNG